MKYLSGFFFFTVEYHISKGKVDDLKALHRLCFNSPGKVPDKIISWLLHQHTICLLPADVNFLLFFAGNTNKKKFAPL